MSTCLQQQQRTHDLRAADIGIEVTLARQLAGIHDTVRILRALFTRLHDLQGHLDEVKRS